MPSSLSREVSETKDRVRDSKRGRESERERDRAQRYIGRQTDGEIGRSIVGSS